MNYYPFHIGDYASATRHLSWDEDCAYRRLLDAYYTTEKPLPSEARAVCRLVLATTDAQREAVMAVLQEFWELTPDGWVNRRADAEIGAMREKQQKQRDKANKRWQKPATELGIAPALPQQRDRDAVASESDADAMPPTPTPTPTPIEVCGASTSRGRFAPPTPAQVAEYAQSIGAVIDADRFVDFYASKGWKVGKSPMKDWRAAVRNWSKSDTPKSDKHWSTEGLCL